jgi:hypothetical protein
LLEVCGVRRSAGLPALLTLVELFGYDCAAR